MSETIKRPEENSPESHQPKTPVIANLMGEAQENMMEQSATQSGFISFEIVKGGPYRFIGKSVYARAFNSKGSREIFGGFWEKSDWIFAELDNLSEYASDEIYDSALMHWDWFNNEDGREICMLRFGKTELLGYTAGRFMKADTPVPEGMDYIDIPELHIAKGWHRNANAEDAEIMMMEEIERQDAYDRASWIFMAEIYPKPNPNGDSVYGFYIACLPKAPPQE
ncbi:MAG: hypothetical protein FWE69_08755 [Clostridiales bacterium]|nr:hypothetical protein [Clostridiales bacterium]